MSRREGSASGNPLSELERLRRATSDEGRAAAVARRHAAGGRTARENVAALVDPGTFVEYGRLAVAAQRSRRTLDELYERTPADGLVAGIATVNGRLFGERARCVVMAYDYTVLAGTQGAIGHRKKDRMFELVERARLPVVFFVEGGGGRPGDTDFPVASALDVRAFALWARLAGHVPRIAVVNGYCFAGNAVLAGCADLVVATERSWLGMGGPAMIEAGGLGQVAANEIGPAAEQAANGVVDIVVQDEEEAARVVRTLLSYFQGDLDGGEAEAQEQLRTAIPTSSRRAFDIRRVVDTVFDRGSVTYLGERYAPELVTALARLEGRAVAVIANNSIHKAGVITSEAAAKAARFLGLCADFELPVVSFVDTPGFMVGPEHERTGLVRHAGDFLRAGARLRAPLLAVVVRRGFGLGAQAMVGGSLREPHLAVAWAGAQLGPMNLAGAVRLALRRELERVADEAERERIVRDTTRLAEEQGSALNAARLFELDDVIDPVETRSCLARALATYGASGSL